MASGVKTKQLRRKGQLAQAKVLPKTSRSDDDEVIQRVLIVPGRPAQPYTPDEQRAIAAEDEAKRLAWATETGVTWRCYEHKRPDPWCSCVSVIQWVSKTGVPDPERRYPRRLPQAETALIEGLKRAYWAWLDRQGFRAFLARRDQDREAYLAVEAQLAQDGWQRATTEEIVAGVTKFRPKGKKAAPAAAQEQGLPAEPSPQSDATNGGIHEFLIKLFSSEKGITREFAVEGLVKWSGGVLTTEQAAAKIEHFLVAANDPALTPEYRLKARGAEGTPDRLYRLVPVPPAAQTRRGTAKGEKDMAATTKERTKKTAKGATNGTRAKARKTSGVLRTPVGIIASMIEVMSKTPITLTDVIGKLAKKFPDRAPESMTSTFRTNFGGTKPFQVRERGVNLKVTKKDGTIFYQVLGVKAKKA